MKIEIGALPRQMPPNDALSDELLRWNILQNIIISDKAFQCDIRKLSTKYVLSLLVI